MKILSRSEQDTFMAGREFANTLSGGDIVLLDGFLGAGKTVFTKGIAARLGIVAEVLSPTFALMCEYPLSGGLTLCHIDAYRLKNAEEAQEAGIVEVLGDRRTISVVEWYQNIGTAFQGYPCKRVQITPSGENEREIRIEMSGGKQYDQ